MNSAVENDPLRDDQSGDGFAPRAQGALVTTVFLVLGVVVAAVAPDGTWWKPVLLVGAGMGAMGGLYWIRARQQRQAAARTNVLRVEKQEAEEALDAATDRAEKLEEMSAAKSQFLKEVTPAFRRPLTLTLGPIDTLLGEQYGPLSEEAKTQLRLAKRNGIRLLWLVRQLSDLAELETGGMVLRPTEDDLPAFVARSLRTFEDFAERRGVTLEFESTLDDPTVWFDASKMETILANLLSSAFRAAGEDQSVRVVVRPVPSREEGENTAKAGAPTAAIELLIEHTGTEILSGLSGNSFGGASEWEPPQEPGSVSASVGLRLVDKLADLHGGHLHADRSGGETGRFVVRLPRQPAAPEGTGGGETTPRTDDETRAQFLDDEEGGSVLALSRTALSNESPADGSVGSGTTAARFRDPKSKTPLPGEEVLPDRGAKPGEGDDTERDSEGEDRTTILVIDDNSVICTLVRAHLEPEYRVEEAHNGAEGYNLARALLPDLVITDVMMPEVDGFELCKKIKEDPDIDHVPVVFLTARAALEDKVEGFDTGADAYLTKPFEPEELIARVESLIATRRTLQESFRAKGGNGAGQGTPADGLDLGVDGVENAEAALPPTAESNSLKEQIEEAIAEHLPEPEFGVSELASATALSASQLRRRMKEIYDRTPVQLIRRRRLEAGMQLLRKREDATIGEVAYAVGFNSQSYFSRSFREEFGTSPSQYRREGLAA